MKKLLIILFGIFITLLSYPVLAQPEDPGVDPAAPISDYLWVLAVIGFAYVFYKIRKFALQSDLA